MLTASALNAEFDNWINNALAAVSPLTGALNFNGNTLQNLAAGAVGSPGLYFSSDSNTGLYQSAVDIIDFALGGVRGFQIASASSGVNWILATPGATAVWPTLSAQGDDTNLGIRFATKGTAYLGAKRGASIGENFWPSYGFYEEHGRAEVAGVMQIAAGTLDLVAGGRRVLQASAYVNATNYLRVTPSQAGSPVIVDVAGGDTNIDLQLAAKGSGIITAATAFRPAANTSNPPVANALVQDNIVKGWIVFKGTTTASIYGSFNVASLTHTSTGDYTVTWDRDFAATTYVIAGSSEHISTSRASVGTGLKATGTTQIYLYHHPSNTIVDKEVVDIIAIGRQ